MYKIFLIKLDIIDLFGAGYEIKERESKELVNMLTKHFRNII